MKLITLLIPSIALAGCASVRETYAPDGRKAYALNCSGTARNWGHCQNAAGKICGASGYDVLNQMQEGGFQMGASANRYNGSMYAGTTSARTMMIACRQ